MFCQLQVKKRLKMYFRLENIDKSPAWFTPGLPTLNFTNYLLVEITKQNKKLNEHKK